MKLGERSGDRTERASGASGSLPLVVRDLQKRYKGDTWANRGISLSVEPGELLGILGPNGAGKTTLVRQITTELLPTSGEIRVFGHDVVAHPSRVKSLIGVMPQEAELYHSVTVYHHLRIFGKLRGLAPSAAARRAEELIQDLHLSDYRDVTTERLSGGLKRRVLVAMASLARPLLLVLDEPTTGLDPQSRRDLWSLLRRHREAGTTVLLTTHYMEEAEALCDRVGIIQDGKLLALDTVDNLRASQGFSFKLTYMPDDSALEPEVLYGAADRELVARVSALGIDQYSVSRTSLEDVYLALTDGKGRLDADFG